MKCSNCGQPLRQNQIFCECKRHTIIKIGPENGLGQFTWVEGYRFPFPGYPNQIVCAVNDVVKRSVVASLKYGLIFRPIKWFKEISTTAYHNYYPPKIDSFCKSGRELYKAGVRAGVDENLIKNICMLWEFDVSYRFRGQDLFEILYKNRNPYGKIRKKDFLKAIEICKSREKSGDPLIKKWNMLKWLVRFFWGKIEKTINEIDLEEMFFTDGDWYWICERYDYDYDGVSFQERVFQRVDDKYFSGIYIAK